MSDAATCGNSSRTVGYIVKGSHGKFFQYVSGNYCWSSDPTIYPTIQAAIAAIIKDERLYHNGYQSLTILKVVESTYSESRTSYEAL